VIPRLLPTSGDTIRGWILEKFASSRDTLRTSLNWAPAAIHISFDLWTSPNHRAFLATIGHYLDFGTSESRSVLLGFRRIRGSHSGENQADSIWQVAEELGITRKLGYFTTDNASSNDKAMEYLAKRSSDIGVPFDHVSRRIRCFGHILNLVVKAFLWGENPMVLEVADDDTNPEEQLEALRAWRKNGPLGRLYNCIRHVLKTPQRREQFQEKARYYCSEGEPLGLIIGNDTRWNGDLAAIVRALVLREPLADYLSFAIRSDRRRDESSLIHDELSPEDWDILKAMVEILEPFKKWTLFLQRKGVAARLSDILPAYDELLGHLESQRQRYESTSDTSTHLITSINNAWIVLNK
jgi:hypothetical protein